MNLSYPSVLLPEIERAAGTRVALPSDAAARARLLDVAFYAGLQQEEGRALSFALTFISPEAVDALGHTPFSALVFDTAVDLSVEQVVRLAPALDHRFASIGVNEGPRGLQIWGFYQHGSSEYEMLEGLENGATRLGVDYLRIVSERPGRLDVDIGLSRIASLVGGEIERGIMIFVEPGPVFDLLLKAGQAQNDRSYVQSVQQIVWAIRAAQHGGTLLFLPDHDMRQLQPRHATKTSRATDDVRDRAREYYRAAMRHSNVIQQVADAETASENVSPWLGHQSRIATAELFRAGRNVRESVRFCAALANVDGALVLGPDLHVLAFGTMIERSENVSFDVHVAKNASGETREVVNVGRLGGARHQSAAQFCKERVGALAFVVSQDGGVSCLINDGAVLRAWKGVRLDRRQPPKDTET
jgi:hypothetical protein